MSKSRQKQRQAIDIAHNIVLAQIAVPALQTRHCDLVRDHIGKILSNACGETIMEAQVARQFDALDREKQLLVLSTALAGIPTVVSPGLEWTVFDNPLALKINSHDIHRARLLYFKWQSLAEPESSARSYLYEHWQMHDVPERRRHAPRSPGIARGHA